MAEHLLVADLTAACGVPQSRISETCSALGIASKGRRLMKLTIADGIKVAIVRELAAAGLSTATAAHIARQIREADLADIIAHERRMWLLVRRDPTGQSEFAFTLADLKEATEIIANEPDDVVAQVTAGEQPRNIRIVDLYKVIRAVLTARLERVAAEDKRAAESRVTAYSAAKGASGIQLHRSLKLAVFKNGRGHAIQLDPAMARELAGNLLRLADEAEAPPKPEDIN
jgi:hypothetical protein